jgi:hypothetical protein
MNEPDIGKYCDLMEEIKKRVSVIDFFLFGGGHTLYQPTTIETVSLQLRKILELIAFGSLVANKEAYSSAYEKFATHWNARFLLRDLERVNQDFYPKPVVEIPSPDPRALHQLKDRDTDYLTREEFEKAYEKIGAIMHAANPYGSKVDLDYYLGRLPTCWTEILNLLNNHQVRLLNDRGFYVIHMKEDRDDKVHYYRFDPAPSV